MAAMIATMAAVAMLAVSMLHTTMSGPVVLAASYTDPAHNPFLGSGKGGFGTNPMPPQTLDEEYMGPNPDSPGKPGDWQWATTQTADGDYVFGHGPDWIYQDGWEQHIPDTLKGPKSYYYNALRWDENAQTDESIPEEDTDNYNFIANERSLPDHSTTEPYTQSSSLGVLTGPNAVDQILGFDDYLMNSNGIY